MLLKTSIQNQMEAEMYRLFYGRQTPEFLVHWCQSKEFQWTFSLKKKTFNGQNKRLATAHYVDKKIVKPLL